IDKASVPAFLASLSDARPGARAESREQGALRALCSSLGEPISASVLVHYRRLAFQTADDTLRVTLDDELSYYLPPSDLWTRERALLRGSFGSPAATESFCLLEVKRRVPLPTWLKTSLDASRAQQVTFSKFLRAGTVIHGSA